MSFDGNNLLDARQALCSNAATANLPHERAIGRIGPGERRTGGSMPDTTVLSLARPSEVRLSPNGNLLYSADADGFVRVYNTGTGALVTSWDIGQNLGGMDISPDGGFLVIVERNLSTTYRVDTSTGAKTSYNYATDSWAGLMFDVAVLSDGTALFTRNVYGSGPIELNVLNLTTGVYTPGQQTSQSAVLTRSPTGETVLIGEPNTSAGTIDIYQTGVGIVHQSGAGGYNWGIQAFNGDLAAHYIYNEGIHVYDADLDRLITLTTWNTGKVTDLEFSADGAWLYVLENQNNAIIKISTADWEIESVFPISADVGGWMGQVGATRGGRLILDPQERFFSVITDTGLVVVSDLDDGTLAGTYGADSLVGTADGESAYGFDGDDMIEALAGNDSLYGGSGNDTLLGGAGDDILDGGDDIDTASYADATHGVTIDASLSVAQDTGWGIDQLIDIERVVGSGFGDLLSTPTGAVELFGGGGRDTLLGSAAFDTLHGGAGNDHIFTGGFTSGFTYFSDQIFGDGGNDTIVIDGPLSFPSGGTYDGGLGFDTLELRMSAAGTFAALSGSTIAGIERLRFVSDAGTSLLAVLTLNQATTSGVNQLVGGAGHDSLFLGTSSIGATYTMPNFTLTNWNSSNTLNSAGDLVGLYAAGIGDFVLNAREGLASSQLLAGSTGNDTLNGSSGMDLLDGGGGNNVLNGNGGDDALTIVNRIDFQGIATTYTGAGSSFNGGTGFDRLSVGGAVAFAGTISGIEAIYLQAEIVNTGSLVQPAANLTVSAATMALLPADLELEGIGTIIVNLAPGDSYDAAGFTVVPGSTITHVANGSNANDTIRGSQGADMLYGNAGNDTLIGGEGSDELDGGTGIDTLDYSASATGVSVSLNAGTASGGDAQGDSIAGFEKIVGSALADLLVGDAGVNTLSGGKGQDKLNGLGGADMLFGNSGFDTLFGGGGADRLFGGVGKDTMTGNAANDQFVFLDGDTAATRVGADIITDFNQAHGDLIGLNEMDANTTLAGDQKFKFIGAGAFTGAARELHYVHDGGNTYIEGDTDGDGLADFVIRLDGLINLTSGDFVL